MNFSGIAGLVGLNSGAEQNNIARAEKELGFSLLAEHVAFLRHADGALLKNGICVYAAAELAERNETYEISEYLPGYLLIGDDSGGVGFVLSMSDGKIYSSGLGDLNPTDLHLVAKSMQNWVDGKLLNR